MADIVATTPDLLPFDAPVVTNTGAHTAGSAFGLPDKPVKWIGATTYCDAMEPLLRLAARDTDHFSDATGEEGKPQVQ